MPRTDTRGEGSAMAKLNDTKVIAIRRAYDSGVYTQEDLARHYDVSPATINRVVTNKTWKHIPKSHPSNESVTNQLNKSTE